EVPFGWRVRLAWLAIALAAAMAAALPFLVTLASDADYIAFGNESIAYRYFFCCRVQEGEKETAWLPQGQALSAMQQGILLTLRHLPGWDHMDLRQQVNLFGRCTSGAIVLLHALILVVCGQLRSLNWADKLVVFSIGLFPLYVLRSCGF